MVCGPRTLTPRGSAGLLGRVALISLSGMLFQLLNLAPPRHGPSQLRKQRERTPGPCVQPQGVQSP